MLLELSTSPRHWCAVRKCNPWIMDILTRSLQENVPDDVHRTTAIVYNFHDIPIKSAILLNSACKNRKTIEHLYKVSDVFN